MKLILKHFGKIITESLLEEGKEYLIGRHKDCDFVLREETGLSRNHVKIYQSSESGNWIVESISELGGLYLEGEEIESVELEDSSVLALKNYVFEFVKEEKQQEEKSSVQKSHPSLEEKKEESLSLSTRIFNDKDLIYSLYVYIDGEFSDHISLNEGQSWIIGRSEECDISIDYSILTRKHLQISRTNGDFYVKDLGSSNKTVLNGKELKPQEAVILKANDEISVSDLRMVFEVRNRNFEQMMSNLSVITPEYSDSVENLPAMAFPKVVLEEAPQEEEKTISKKPRFLNKKRIILLTLPVVLGFGLYFKYESEKKKKRELAQQQKDKEYKSKLEVFYNDALANLDAQRYQLCIDQIEELHQMSSGGYFKDSQQILIQCHNALESQKQKEEYLAQEEMKKQNEAKIKEIADECKRQFAEGAIQTEEDLNLCAAELLGGLDPGNSEISAIRMEILEKENLKRMEEEKRQAYQARIGSKRALYNRAKKIRGQKELNEAPEVVKAYDVFLKSAKGFSPLQKLYKEAELERDEIQGNYDRELERLHKSCESLFNSSKMKEAYYDCKKVLKFKEDDEKAKKYMKLAKSSLQKELKPLYEQSMLDESFSRIEQALKLWNEILTKDIQEGYYYRKAVSQIAKYK